MSDINGSGYGDAHDWEDRGTSPYRVTTYRCRTCGAVARHAYDDNPDIFDAMRRAGVPEICAKEE